MLASKQRAFTCHRPARKALVKPTRGTRTLTRVSIPTDILVVDPEAVQNGSYVALGLAGASFVATFFVLPRFYEKNVDWKTMLPALRENGVRSISPSEAYKKSRSAVLLDVRLPDKFQEVAASKSINVPLYTPIQNWDIPSVIRRVGFAFFGVYGTELNPNFVNEVQAAVSKGREIMVICESGGSIEASTGSPRGSQSRSLKAIYYLQQAGFTKVSHVTGGLGQWVRDGLPTSQDEDDQDGEPVGAFTGFSLPFLASASTSEQHGPAKRKARAASTPNAPRKSSLGSFRRKTAAKSAPKQRTRASRAPSSSSSSSFNRRSTEYEETNTWYSDWRSYNQVDEPYVQQDTNFFGSIFHNKQEDDDSQQSSSDVSSGWDWNFPDIWGSASSGANDQRNASQPSQSDQQSWLSSGFNSNDNDYSSSSSSYSGDNDYSSSSSYSGGNDYTSGSDFSGLD